MKRIFATALATSALIASGALAATETAPAGADDTAVMGVDAQGDITASRGDDAPRSHDIYVDDQGYLVDYNGMYLVDMDGNAVQPDLSSRLAGSDNTALTGVDDEGVFTSSRGNNAERAHNMFVDDEGYAMDAENRYFVTAAGDRIMIDWNNRKAGADDTAVMGVDSKGEITASRGNDAVRASDTVGDAPRTVSD
jgi:flagellar basal body rod protein FlgG